MVVDPGVARYLYPEAKGRVSAVVTTVYAKYMTRGSGFDIKTVRTNVDVKFMRIYVEGTFREFVS